MELRFLDFLLEAHSQCKYDYVEVRSGSTVLGKFCGTTKPSPMIATSGSMTVTFVTDRTVTKRGFWSIYKAISPDIGKYTAGTACLSVNCLFSAVLIYIEV